MKRVSLKTPRQIIMNYLVILQFPPKREQNRSKSKDIFLPCFEKYSVCFALQKMQIFSYQAEPDGEKREEKSLFRTRSFIKGKTKRNAQKGTRLTP